MLFNSVIFITVFLPLALLGWFLLQKLEDPAWAKAFLIGMSFWFYGYYNVSYLWILLVSLAGNYAFSFLLRRIRGGGFRRGLFVCGVLGNLGLLFYLSTAISSCTRISDWKKSPCPLASASSPSSRCPSSSRDTGGTPPITLFWTMCSS